MPIDLHACDAVLLDLDGTIYHEEHPIPGAVEFIRRLEAAGKRYACLTNSTSSPARIARRLGNMGVPIDPGHIYTAAAAAVDYVVERFSSRRPRVFNLATEGVQEMLEGRAEFVRDKSEACDAVICGAPGNVFATDENRRTALYLLRQGAVLVVVCADRIFPGPRGMEFGAGALGHMMGYAAGVTPVFCGKPQRLFFEELCRRVGVPAPRCVLIGDNLEADIAGGKSVGMKTILTLTGVTHRDDLPNHPPDRQPDHVVENLHELL